MASKRLPAARQCRDYQARTERTVRSAIESWKRIFETDCPEPNLAVGGTCTSYANRIKAVISECPSSELDQVMAWQSIKKLLPASCRCMESNLLESLQSKLSSPSRLSPVVIFGLWRMRLVVSFPAAGTAQPTSTTFSPPLPLCPLPLSALAATAVHLVLASISLPSLTFVSEVRIMILMSELR